MTPEQLEAACRGRIAGYKIPRHWKLVDSFPMTVTGKVQKFRLRELAAEAPVAPRRKRRSRAVRGLVLTTATVAAILPASAGAATFYVAAPGCPAGGTSTGADLQAALDAAAAHGGADDVLVGDKGSAYLGPFSCIRANAWAAGRLGLARA